MCNGVFCVTWNEIPYRVQTIDQSADWDLGQEYERGDAAQFPHSIITTPPPTFLEAKTSEESIGSADAANRRTSVSKERQVYEKQMWRGSTNRLRKIQDCFRDHENMKAKLIGYLSCRLR